MSHIQELTVLGVPNQPKLFSDGRRWAGIDGTFFLDFNYAATPVGDMAIDVFRRCMSCTEGTEIVAALPSWTAQAFDAAEVSTNLERNMFDVIRFFRQFFLTQVDSIDADSRDRLLLDALRKNNEKLNQVSDY